MSGVHISSITSLSSFNFSSILGAAGQLYFRKRSRCATEATWVFNGATHSIFTVLPLLPCASTFASGKTLLTSAIALLRSWSPPCGNAAHRQRRHQTMCQEAKERHAAQDKEKAGGEHDSHLS